MISPKLVRRVVLKSLLLISLSIQANNEGFPDALTLQAAVNMLDDAHPALLQYSVNQAKIEEDQVRLNADTALQAEIRLELRAADKSITPGTDFIDDSRSILLIDKPLTQFGRDDSLDEVLQGKRNALEQQLAYGKSGLRLQVMEAFFDTLISDLAYAAADEEMTLAYLSFEDAEQELVLGEVTEIEVSRKQAIYLKALAKREIIAGEQRTNRLKLALALNRSNAIPSRLIEPNLSSYDRELPQYAKIIERAIAQNPMLKTLQLQLDSVSSEMAVRGGKTMPTLGVRFQAADYAQDLSTNRDTYRGSIYLDIPLTNQREKQVELAELNTQMLELQARMAITEHALRIEVLELLKRLEQLQIHKQSAEAELLYRELELDKVRSQYQMEIRARIGQANTMVAKALTDLARIEYETALTWEQFDLLVGNTPVEFE